MTFADLNLLEPILRAVTEKGYITPSAIQLQAIPAVLNNRDAMACAQTGTGKTAAFVLPILHRLAQKPQTNQRNPRVLIVTPTRELAAQIQQNIFDYGKYLKIRSAVVFGGVSINPQISALQKGVDILVATPGRLLDLHQQRMINFKEIEIFVLDEADRMLDMGFIQDIKKVMALMPQERQNLLFSATFSPEIRALTKGFLRNPVEVNVAPRITTAKSVQQTVHPADKSRKIALLSHLIRSNNWSQVLVFCRTKHGADKLVKQLYKDNIHAQAIHGNKSQNHRTRTLSQFKGNELRILVATDIAARGIDIIQLPYVINFDLPDKPEDYVHRIGRTGRAGCEGHAISLVSADEFKQLQSIERLIKHTINREEIENFEPLHQLTLSLPAHHPIRKPPHQHQKNKTSSYQPRKASPQTLQLKQTSNRRNRKPNVITG